MIEMAQKLHTVAINFLHRVEVFLEPFIKNLDPSLLQNIILGILAIFIPFAIVLLTDILGRNKERTGFEKMVLSQEVLGVKKIFWLSVLGLGILSFFTGKDISVLAKVIAILITLILIIIFGRFFKKTLQFSEGYKPEFEISFLRRLNLSILFRFRNKIKSERMIRAWDSFWSEQLTVNEKEFTEVFIRHVDDAIVKKQYNLAISLAQAYKKNIEKRDRFSMGYEILAKLFKWNEELWLVHQKWLYKMSYVENVNKTFSAKYFPTFKRWGLSLANILDSKDDFWNWHYFQHELFPAIVKVLLNDNHSPYQLFTGFKKHIDEAEAKLESFESDDKRQGWWNQIMGMIGSFCPVFFDNINNVSQKYEIWEHNFPGEWKISSSNSNNRISRVVLHEFMQWSKDRLVRKHESEEYDQDVTEVVNGIFPNVHQSLFPIFLMLISSSEVKYALEKIPSFFVVNIGVSWSGEKNDQEIEQMFTQQDLSRKEETLDIIFQYFSYWSMLKVYKDDLTEDETAQWEQYSESQRKVIIDKVRFNKLQNSLNILESQEIIDSCKKSEQKESRRLATIELLELLLNKISKN